jgi:hypothetical protein
MKLQMIAFARGAVLALPCQAQEKADACANVIPLSGYAFADKLSSNSFLYATGTFRIPDETDEDKQADSPSRPPPAAPSCSRSLSDHPACWSTTRPGHY